MSRKNKKKNSKKNPSVLQQRAIVEVAKDLEKHGKVSVSAAMRRAGYSEATAKNPKNLTKTKTWQDLMDEYLPDDLLQKVHREGLEATRVVSANITYGDADEKTNDFIDIPDYAVRKQYLELGYKIKNKIVDRKSLEGPDGEPLSITITEDTTLKDAQQQDDTI